MQYAGLILNDLAAAPGLCVTFFTQGCPHKCPGCQNPETWDFRGGLTFNTDVLDQIIEGINAQGIQRNLCIMGGEPLCPQNTFLTYLVVSSVKEKYPDTKVYIWTGYIYEDLVAQNDLRLNQIFNITDYIIDGPYISYLRDITLPMRGSSNQRIIDLKKQKK